MKKKFIFIDNSIISMEGHHFEYAKRIIEKIDKSSFKVYLVVNKKCKVKTIKRYFEDVECINVYKRTFWGNKPARTECSENKHISRIYGNLKKIYFKFIYSKFYHCILSFNDEASVYLLTKKFSMYRLMFTCISLVILLPVLILILIITAPFLLGFFLINKIFSFISYRLFDRVIYFVKVASNFSHKQYSKYVSFCFAKTTKKTLLRTIKASSSDIVFIPNARLEDILSIAYIFEEESVNINWHLLIRREFSYNYYGEAINEYERRKSSQYRTLLRLIQTKFRGEFVHFYTDTEALTDQYNSLRVMKFTTLPIPAETQNILGEKVISDKVKITYLGDARQEKGYHNIPEIYQYFNMTSLASSIEFHIQSNYSSYVGENIICAISLLNNYSKMNRNLFLYTKEMLPEEYGRLVDESDIVLLTYDDIGYSLRSSGIFAEALYVGKTVLVPAKSWMSKILMPEIYKYYTEIKQCHNILSKEVILAKKNIKNLKIGVDYEIPEGAKYILVEIKINKLFNNNCINIKANFQYQEKQELVMTDKNQIGMALIQIPPQEDKVSLDIFTDLNNHFLEEMTINFMQTEKHIPISTVGIIYVDKKEINDKIEELICNIDYYKNTAALFAKNVWQKKHNSKKIIEKIIANNQVLGQQ